MDLTTKEKHWLPWLGATGKLALGKACWLNKDRKKILEQTFTSTAETRVHILTSWVSTQWNFLHDGALYITSQPQTQWKTSLQSLMTRNNDISELFIVVADGQVAASSYHNPIQHKVDQTILTKGLQAPFLHGPYLDSQTQLIGPSSSNFHDAVTLMFYQPILKDNQVIGCLCARVPNDVMGDLIQREAGHIYSESGDNYIFMVSRTWILPLRAALHFLDPALKIMRFLMVKTSNRVCIRNGEQSKYNNIRNLKYVLPILLRNNYTQESEKQLNTGKICM